MEEVIKKLQDIINWYTKYSDNVSIAEIMRKKDILAGYLAYIQEQESKYSSNHNTLYGKRKYTFSITKSKIMDSGQSGTYSDEKAETEIKEIREEEILNYNIGNRLNGILKSGDRIINAMQQRISWMRKEEEYSRLKDQST